MKFIFTKFFFSYYAVIFTTIWLLVTQLKSAKKAFAVLFSYCVFILFLVLSVSAFSFLIKNMYDWSYNTYQSYWTTRPKIAGTYNIYNHVRRNGIFRLIWIKHFLREFFFSERLFIRNKPIFFFSF